MYRYTNLFPLLTWKDYYHYNALIIRCGMIYVNVHVTCVVIEARNVWVRGMWVRGRAAEHIVVQSNVHVCQMLPFLFLLNPFFFNMHLSLSVGRDCTDVFAIPICVNPLFVCRGSVWKIIFKYTGCLVCHVLADHIRKHIVAE